MSSRYENIKTLDDLEKAILFVKAEQKATGKSISNETGRLLNALKPANLVSNLVSNLVPSSLLADAGLGLVHGLRKILTGSKKGE